MSKRVPNKIDTMYLDNSVMGKSTFQVNGIVHEGIADRVYVAAEASGSEVLKFAGTTITVSGDKTLFNEKMREAETPDERFERLDWRQGGVI